MGCLNGKAKTGLMGLAMILISYGVGSLQAGDLNGAVSVILGIVIIALKYHYNIPNNENNRSK